MPFPAITQAERDDFEVRFTKDISLEGRPTLARAIATFDLKAEPPTHTSKGLLELFQAMFDDMGPYRCAKEMRVLKNGSGEDLAVEFMGLYNQVFGTRY